MRSSLVLPSSMEAFVLWLKAAGSMAKAWPYAFSASLYFLSAK